MHLTWLSYIITVFASLLILIFILYLYYKNQNKKIFSSLLATLPSTPEDALPRLAGFNHSLDKMDEMFQEADFSKGSILFDVPIIMDTGKKYRIVSKIASNNKLLIKEKETSFVHEILVTDLMSCKLSGEAFIISIINNEIQKIFKNDITHWQWDVIPRKGGIQSLLLLASIHIRTGNEIYLKDIPVFERPIVVQINPTYHIKQFFKKNWQWLVGTLVGSGILWEVLKLKLDK